MSYYNTRQYASLLFLLFLFYIVDCGISFRSVTTLGLLVSILDRLLKLGHVIRQLLEVSHFIRFYNILFCIFWINFMIIT